MRRTSPSAGLLLAGLVGLSSCLSLNYDRTSQYQPVSARAVAEDGGPTVLLAEGMELADCLARLGAPNFVLEEDVHGLLLVWLWTRDEQWSFSISYAVSDYAPSVSFNFSDLDQDQAGLVLWFDAAWRLERFEEGDVLSLIGERRVPATLERIEERG